MNRDHTSPSSLTWVTTCAALHNVCLPAGNVLEPEDDVDGVQVPPPCPGRNEQQGQGARKRLAAQRPAPVEPEQLLHQFHSHYSNTNSVGTLPLNFCCSEW
ncbi:hypothetical protein AAFF_G00324240 [Aldrovandia affinis]|uniref:Uncharacterized protein n=1 Tax=Aldrovandia affinis TaxID=143900 RepID=A0AAD7R747_9TELE|nr:hypothetical protein AAFF_G00324240 [Aldrovandia affinis]